MQPNTIRAVTQGVIAVIAVGIGGAYALVAQAHGASPEPPAWLAILIGGAVTYFYATTSHQNGSTQAISALTATIAARRQADVVVPAPPAPSPPSAMP